MTDPTQQTTPTRDEAVRDESKVTTAMIDAAFKVCPAGAISEIGTGGMQRMLAAALASAPAPASGRVDAVAVEVTDEMIEAGKEAANGWTDRYMDGAEFVRWDDALPDIFRRMLELASLSPAATPVSEAGGEAVKVLATLNRMVTDYLAPDTYKARFPKDSTLWEREFSMPDKHHSDAGAALVHRRRDAAFIRDVIHLQDNPTGVEPSEPGTLAKPASSPADVVQTLIDKTEKLIEAADDMAWSCNSSSADQAIREARDAVRAALSQSTSAGRVGG